MLGSTRISDRLDSWKEIAAFLRRDVRTVQRWEREGLPVHRHIHHKRGSVFAYETEIDRWLKSRTKQCEIRSLVVLPLRSLSRSSGPGYFADGMTEALITSLAKIEAIRVISRASAMCYKGTRKPLQEIARELNVEFVVEGTVMRAGSRVQITANLIHASSDRCLWAENYERDLRDVLTLQGEVARAIAAEIRVKLRLREQAQLSREHLVIQEAHEAYLKGRFHWSKRSPKDLGKSLEHLQRAIDLDPSYALAYVGIAETYLVLGSAPSEMMAPTEAMSRARSAANKALEIDETLGEAHAVLAYIDWMHDYDWEAADRRFRRALELSPGYATARQWYGVFCAQKGSAEPARTEIERARETDPLSLQINTAVAEVYYFLRDYDRAIDHARKTLELEDTYSRAYLILALAYLQKGMLAEGLAESRKAARFSGKSTVSLACIGGCYAAIGRASDAMQIVGELKRRSKHHYVPSYTLAWIFAHLRDKEATLEHLKRAYAERSGFMALIKVDPALDFLRSERRFRELQKLVDGSP